MLKPGEYFEVSDPAKVIFVGPTQVWCAEIDYDTIAAALAGNEMTPLYDLLQEAADGRDNPSTEA